MKKLAKKVVATLTIATMMAMTLTGCAKNTECGECGEKAKCYKYEFDNGQGESGKEYLCDDCAEQIEAIIDMIKALDPESDVVFKKLK